MYCENDDCILRHGNECHKSKKCDLCPIFKEKVVNCQFASMVNQNPHFVLFCVHLNRLIMRIKCDNCEIRINHLENSIETINIKKVVQKRLF
jgi:hypothetical protein